MGIIRQEEARRYLSLRQGVKMSLCFGTNHINKDYEVIFQAFQSVPRDSCYLLFARSLVTDDRTRDPSLLAQKYGCVENTIVVNQFVSESEKIYYFSASDAIILSNVQSFIASTSLINEACQFSLPVIASDMGQLGDYVTNYNLGLLFLPDNPGSLRQAITSFLHLGEDEKQAMKANFHRFASDLSWREVAERYKALYLRQIPAPLPESPKA